MSLKLISQSEKLVYRLPESPVVLVDPDESWQMQYGSTIVRFRRVPLRVLAEYGDRDPMAYAILEWQGVVDEHDKPLAFSPSLVDGLPPDFRKRLNPRLDEVNPDGMTSQDSGEIYYRRIARHIQQRLEAKYVQAGQVANMPLMLAVLEHAITGWSEGAIVDLRGETVPYNRHAVGDFPSDLGSDLVKVLYGSNPMETDLGNSNGSWPIETD